MGILKYKYKAHKLINTLFYVVVFVIGFVLGFGAEKIDFNKLVSQVLMIDNAKAYTITTTSSGEVINEDFIISKFSSYISDFDVNDYEFAYYKWSGQQYWTVYAIVKENIHLAIQDSSDGDLGYGSVNCNIETGKPCYYLFNIRTSGSQAVSYASSGGVTIQYSNFDSLSQYNSSFTYNYSSKNKLDFSKHTVKLEYNENLFKDNPDFKQVCVNPDTRFAITSNNITYTDEETELKYFNGIDFIWFSYVPDGLTTYLYSSAEETKKTPLTKDGPLFNGINPGKWYYLDEKEEIDKFFNTNSSKGEIYPGVTLELEGYTDKYSYFGWYFHPFVVHFDNTQDGNNFFNVFHFKDKLNFYSILENGLDYYEELENARNGNICFYIKNTYDITILNKDIFDDDIGESTILGGDKFNINTTENSSSLNSKGLFSKINLFINNIKDTILFINGYIYELYVSLPNIVQLFIVAVFGLIVVRILVGMVTK